MLSSGPEPDPDAAPRRPRPRWLSAVGGAALVVVLAVLAVRDGTGRSRPPRPVPSPTVALASPTPAPRAYTFPPPPEAVYRIDGDPGPGPPGVRLVVGGRRPGVLDVATGRLIGLTGLPYAAGEVVELRRGTCYTVALVYRPSDDAFRAVVLPDSGGAVELGAVDQALPLRDGSLLTVVCPTGYAGECRLSSRTATGALRWQRRPPEPTRLVRETAYGVLVLSGADGRSARLQVEDPRTGRVVRDLGRTPAVLAATDRLVAWQPYDCLSACPVLVADLADGSVRVMPGSAGRAAFGAFSPDGGRLAVGFWGLHSHDPDRSRQRDGYAAVLDLRTPAWFRVPGLTTGAKAAPLPLWTPDGSRLLLATGDDGVGRIASWTPGSPRLTVLPARLDGLHPQPGNVELLP